MGLAETRISVIARTSKGSIQRDVGNGGAWSVFVPATSPDLGMPLSWGRDNISKMAGPGLLIAWVPIVSAHQ